MLPFYPLERKGIFYGYRDFTNTKRNPLRFCKSLSERNSVNWLDGLTIVIKASPSSSSSSSGTKCIQLRGSLDSGCVKNISYVPKVIRLSSGLFSLASQLDQSHGIGNNPYMYILIPKWPKFEIHQPVGVPKL